jgi:hypothetical protein
MTCKATPPVRDLSHDRANRSRYNHQQVFIPCRTDEVNDKSSRKVRERDYDVGANLELEIRLWTRATIVAPTLRSVSHIDLTTLSNAAVQNHFDFAVGAEAVTKIRK